MAEIRPKHRRGGNLAVGQQDSVDVLVVPQVEVVGTRQQKGPRVGQIAPWEQVPPRSGRPVIGHVHPSNHLDRELGSAKR